MNANHTPGPWNCIDLAPPAIVEAERDGEQWCIAEVGTSEMPSNENKANARLIAAAPELLAALGAIVRDTREVLDLREDMTMELIHAIHMRAVREIAKATGQKIEA
jgi:hypothetical protein